MAMTSDPLCILLQLLHLAADSLSFAVAVVQAAHLFRYPQRGICMHSFLQSESRTLSRKDASRHALHHCPP